MSVRKFKPGDLVVTPLGRQARVTKTRRDGLLDLQYVAETVTLRPELVERVEAERESEAA